MRAVAYIFLNPDLMAEAGWAQPLPCKTEACLRGYRRLPGKPGLSAKIKPQQPTGHAMKKAYLGIDSHKEQNVVAIAMAGRGEPELYGRPPSGGSCAAFEIRPAALRSSRRYKISSGIIGS